MKYIKKFEKSESYILRNKYVGKYSIIKSTPYNMRLIYDDMNKELYFLIYIVPGTSDGYMYKTYTSLIVGFKDNKEIIKTISKDIMKNIKKSKFNHNLVKNLNLSYIDDISLFTTTKYDKAFEMLEIIENINKYNL